MEGFGARRHQMSWRRQKWGDGGGGGGEGPSGYGGSVLAGAAGAARGSWCELGRLRCTRGGRSRGDGSVDEWKAEEAVAGTRGSALGSSVVDVEGGRRGSWSTGWEGFRQMYGGRDEIVECMGEEMPKSTSPIERGVQGAGVDSFLDASGQVVVLSGEVGDVFGMEVVVRGAGMVAYGRFVGVGEGLGDFVVMFF
jgi:hypothetical protein